MWLVVGLGNPGRKYSRTRHNVGFMAIEAIADRYKIGFKEREGYRIGRGSIEGHEVVLIEPLLYMNASGPVVQHVCKKFNIQTENLIVIHDDLDMETGRMKIRRNGSSGGHKGIESVIQSIGSRDFLRVKIGIGRDAEIPAEEYVLKKFKRHELPVIKEFIQRAADAVFTIFSAGAEKAMNRFN